ncbi:MAG: sensor histidine kinase [Gemmatimonadaceae bacterium]|nr:sensor histidine kinase [Gemmatimonadaceae bacterium]
MTEFAAALLLALIALGGAGYCSWLYTRFRKPYYAWWSASWALYAVRVGIIIGFIRTQQSGWLFWHQVLTGWTALGFLAAGISFARGTRFTARLGIIALFPVVWSYIAIFALDNFLLAVVPAIAFLSAATLITGVSFARHAQRTGSPGAWTLAAAFTLWAVHHLDYPLLRARGAWVPWGYYLDIVFILAVLGGIGLLVIDDLRRGLEALARLSADVQASARGDDVVAALLQRPLRLRGVSGTALYHVADATVLDGAGRGQHWRGAALPEAVAAVVAQAVRDGRSSSAALPSTSGGERFVAGLPIYRDALVTHVLVLTGDVRDPFSALDEDFLRALGRQVGSALQQAELTLQLEERTGELARLSSRLVEQHEDERKRLARELHDETGQLFSAMRMEVDALHGVAGADVVAQRLDALVTAGLTSLRRVTAALRPSLLDDLGLLSAVRSLVAQVSREGQVHARLDAPPTMAPMPHDRELALFRAAQEGMTNVIRHAGARELCVTIRQDGDEVLLTVDDDGVGPPTRAQLTEQERGGHVGLVGMRERMMALGGRVTLERSPLGGTRLAVRLGTSATAPLVTT